MIVVFEFFLMCEELWCWGDLVVIVVVVELLCGVVLDVGVWFLDLLGVWVVFVDGVFDVGWSDFCYVVIVWVDGGEYVLGCWIIGNGWLIWVGVNVVVEFF